VIEDQLFGTTLLGVHPAALTRLVERLLWHIGFEDVSNVDGSGDGGADVVAIRGTTRWVLQVKSSRSGAIPESAVNELLSGLQNYGAHRGAVVTNTLFSKGAVDRAKTLRQATGVDIGLWARSELVRLGLDAECRDRFSSPNLRPYQVEAFLAVRSDLEKRNAAFLVLATGLGKTVIAGTVIDWFLSGKPDAQVLVLAHTRDLVDQLERALWRCLPKSVPTQQLQGDEKPTALPGVTVATVQSAITYVRNGFRPDFIFVDEAHHTGGDTYFAEILETCDDALRLGATATPWRGDEFDVTTFFGDPSYKIGIEDGMRLGYLVDVDYRLFVDNIDWDYVRSLSSGSYSIPELNSRLFLPQRDEQIRDELLDVWHRTPNPRGIVFCQTVEHADKFLEIIRRVPLWSRAAAIHSKLGKNEQKTNLAKFRLGDIPILVAVDILNEGVDVPDVNIVCFARVTHSRRIFVQQLGRGLRLSEGKTMVTVLDFVSDLRRVRETFGLRQQVVGHSEDLLLPSSHSITFNDAQAESLLREWVFDAADTETPLDEVRLNFPPTV
jgi:superfamily II DNA or RNA helicase